MIRAGLMRFDVGALQILAGEKVFARGQAYHRDDQVEILAVDAERVLAQVSGTEDYRTELSGRGEDIGGACSCPAFEDRGFCKHMVATALAANDLDTDAEDEGAGTLSRIREHLKQQGVDVLVEMILDLAGYDPLLFRKLDMAAIAIGGDDEALEKRLRKVVDDATYIREYVDYRAARGWAAGVNAALDALADLAPAGHAGLAIKLVERAIDRIENAIEGIDDSDGHCGMLLNRCGDIHLAAVQAIGPEPIGLARALFAREMDEAYDVFAGAAPRYAEPLGTNGLAEYRRLAVEEWEKLYPRSGQTPADASSVGGHDRVRGILDFFAEREGDVDARIALRTKDLSSPWRYLSLVQFCLSEDRPEEALRWAEEALWLFEDERPDERLVVLAAELLEKAGRSADAEAALWCAFKKAPTFELYRHLRSLGGALAFERATEFLHQRSAGETASRWHFPADLLVRVLAEDKAYDAAWAAVQSYGASAGVKEALARASEATHAREAIHIYVERVAHLVEGGGASAYAEAFEFIQHMATLREASDQAFYVASLKERFGRKRNFIKLLG